MARRKPIRRSLAVLMLSSMAGNPKNSKMRRHDMSNVLMLQRLDSNTSTSEFSNLFASAVSTICPQGPIGADSPFQME